MVNKALEKTDTRRWKKRQQDAEKLRAFEKSARDLTTRIRDLKIELQGFTAEFGSVELTVDMVVKADRYDCIVRTD